MRPEPITFFILTITGILLLVPDAYAVNFRDHTGYIPDWAEPMGDNQALGVCSSVEYDTSDWNWCIEFSGYVIDKLNRGSEESELNAQSTQESEKSLSAKGKIFENRTGFISINTYRNDLYGFSIIPPDKWTIHENVELLGSGAALVGFYSNQANPVYTANFIINYVETGESDVSLLRMFSDQEILNYMVKGAIEEYDESYSQTKIINKSIQSFDDGYIFKIEYAQTIEVDGNYVPVHRESISFILDTGNAYWLNFVSTQEDFDKTVGEFRKAAETFYVGPANTFSGIIGRYSDESTGFKLDIPDGWVGHKVPSGAIGIFPLNEKLGDNPEFTMVVTVEDKSSLRASIEKARIFQSSESKDNSCNYWPVSYFLLNGIPARSTGTECGDTSTKTYNVAAKDGKVVSIGYVANSPLNKKKVDDFEKFAGTIQVNSPTSIKDLWREAAGFITSEQEITFDSSSAKLRFDSISPITDFVFDEKNKQVSFKVNEHTDYGSTIISISRIIEGPYTAKMDGKIVEYEITNDLIDKVTEISVDYKQGTHDIIIIGSKLVSYESSPSTLEKPSEQKSEKSSGCLIATATFGSELAPQVQILREIRDNTLLKTSSGSTFMNGFNVVYYLFSPTVADWEKQNPVFKEAVKITITPLLSTLSILNYVDIDSETEMLGYGIGVILLNIGMYFVAPAFVIIRLKQYKK